MKFVRDVSVVLFVTCAGEASKGELEGHWS